MGRQETKSVFVKLVRKYLDNKASKTEIHFIEQYYEHFGNEDDITNTLSSAEKKKLENEIKGNIDVRIKKLVARKSSTWTLSTFQRWAAAAVILLMVSAGVYLFYNHPADKQLVALDDQSGRYKNDVAPGGDKAILILGDGTRVVLDNTKNGTIGEQGNSKVLKINAGKLAYNAQSAGNNVPIKILYNRRIRLQSGESRVIVSNDTRR